MTRAELLQALERWRDAGWLDALGLAFARFVAETDPNAPASLLLGAAWTAQLEGQGHSGLPLDERLFEPAPELGWPLDAHGELRAALVGWPADAAARRSAWQGCASVELDPEGEGGHSPLVVSGGLLYLRRLWRLETRVAAEVRARVAAPADPAVDADAARREVDRLFPPTAGGAGPDWQKVACVLALRRGLTLITGGPGTGKTHTAARLLMLLQRLHRGPQPLRVALAAPTGKAAARLRQSIQQALQALNAGPGPSGEDQRAALPPPPAGTLHALLGSLPGSRRFRHDRARPLAVDLLFVDEASMVHLELMAQVLDALPATARVVLLGDKDQLASVEAGAVMGDLCSGIGQGYTPATAAWVQRASGETLPDATQGPGSALAQQTVVLRHSHRFDGPIGQLADAVNRGDGARAQAVLSATDAGPVATVPAGDAPAIRALALRGRPGATGGYRDYAEQLARRPPGTDKDRHAQWARTVLASFDRFRVLCALRDGPWGVSGLNQSIERAMVDAGWLTRRGEWYEGRPVMVTRNDSALGVFNGDIGIALKGPAGDPSLRCWFLEGDVLRSVSVARLGEVETAFAMTVHKSQGSEFGHVALVLPDEDSPVLTREWVYTGITRARQAFTLVARRPELLAVASGRVTRRISGLKARW